MTYEHPKQLPLPDTLQVSKWSDETCEALGHPVIGEDSYVETFWLPVLGPSSTWLLRRLAGAVTSDDAVPFDTVRLSQALGLGQGTGANAILTRSVYRLVKFRAAMFNGDQLVVRTHLDTVPLPLRKTWPGFLKAHHDAVQRVGATS